MHPAGREQAVASLRHLDFNALGQRLLKFLHAHPEQAVLELRADLSRLREDIPRTYISREDYRADIRDVKDMLTRIFDKLDSKVDK